MTVVDSVTGTADTLLSNVNSYAANHQDGIVALLLFTGVVIAFAGRTLLRPTVFMLGFIPATTTVITFGIAFAQDQKPDHVSILEGLAIGLGLLSGILVGVIMVRLLFHIATFLLCAGFGVVIVFVIHLFLLKPVVDQSEQYILYFAATFAALLAGFFSVSYSELGIILGTSFDGAALAVFSLARFLGHRPTFLPESVSGKDVSPWWAVGYGTATLLLGLFGTLTQRQVAIADQIIAQDAENRKMIRSRHTGSDSVLDPTEVDPLLHLPPDTPATPPYHIGADSPAPASGYGTIENDDSQYSVVHNLGAPALGPSIGAYDSNGKDTNGPLG